MLSTSASVPLKGRDQQNKRQPSSIPSLFSANSAMRRSSAPLQSFPSLTSPTPARPHATPSIVSTKRTLVRSTSLASPFHSTNNQKVSTSSSNTTLTTTPNRVRVASINAKTSPLQIPSTPKATPPKSLVQTPQSTPKSSRKNIVIPPPELPKLLSESPAILSPSYQAISNGFQDNRFFSAPSIVPSVWGGDDDNLELITEGSDEEDGDEEASSTLYFCHFDAFRSSQLCYPKSPPFILAKSQTTNVSWSVPSSLQQHSSTRSKRRFTCLNSSYRTTKQK